jgi:aminopeptidase N
MQARKFFIFSYCCLFFFCLDFSFAQDRSFSHEDSLRGTLNKFRSCFDVHYYELFLKIRIGERIIAGHNRIFFRATESFDTIQIDLFRNMVIDSILFMDRPLRFSRDSNHVFLFFPKQVKKGAFESILFFYHGTPIPAVLPPWQGGFVWTEDSLKRPWVGVACEGLGASSWWPLKDHLSDEPDSVKLTFEVPSELYCVSNGTLSSISAAKEGFRMFSWMVHYPINSYNVTLNIGHYIHLMDVFSSKEQDSLDYYVLDYHEKLARKHFQQVPEILRCFTKSFGSYPFSKDGYALVETPYWGMEHQGAIAYGNHFLNDLYDFDFIIVHETAHEWWGNSLSVTDHADMWIHEAFATYAESMLLENIYGYKTALEYLLKQRKKIVNKESLQGPPGVNYNSWEDTDMYYKGSWMLHTLRNVIHNDSVWFGLLRQLSMQFKSQPVNTAKVIQFVNSYTKSDYSSFFEAYLHCSSIPELQYYYDQNKRPGRFYYRWNSCIPSFNMPLDVVISRHEKRVHPVSDWQFIKMSAGDYATLILPQERFYFFPKKIGLDH